MYFSERQHFSFENVDIIKRLHLRFFKIFFESQSSTPNVMVFGETGLYPLHVLILTKLISS